MSERAWCHKCSATVLLEDGSSDCPSCGQPILLTYELAGMTLALAIMSKKGYSPQKEEADHFEKVVGRYLNQFFMNFMSKLLKSLPKTELVDTVGDLPKVK